MFGICIKLYLEKVQARVILERPEARRTDGKGEALLPVPVGNREDSAVRLAVPQITVLTDRWRAAEVSE